MIDPFSADFRRNPFPLYAQARQMQPVAFFEAFGSWSVFRYDDVRRVLSDHQHFSSQFGPPPAEAGQAAQARRSSTLISSDPPRHTKLRALVNRAFTPRAVAELAPRIQEITDELMARSSEAQPFDLIKELAYPLPVIVIAEMLGIPKEESDRFKVWSDRIVASADNVLGGGGENSDEAHQAMASYFQDVIAERRRWPKDDLISALLAAEVDGERLDEGEVIALCWLLLVAGNETTTNLIGNAILSLLEHPDQLTQLRAHPDHLPSAIEETLRFRSPVQAMFRITTGEVELAGQRIPAGHRVVAWIGSANRDESKFERAQAFDITREPNPHIAFGHGIHFCLGSPLARLEARIALRTFLARCPNFERADGQPLAPAHGFIVHGVTSLPLHLGVGR